MGAFIRVLWFLTHVNDIVPGEPYDVAVNFARYGSLANPFNAITGPTAHLMPLPVIMGGSVYRYFGVATFASEAILTAWSVLLALTSYFFLFRSFQLMGSSVSACLLGLGALCLIPFYIEGEVILFRLWEGALTVAAGSAFLFAVLKTDHAQHTSTKRIAGLGLSAGLVFLISPQAGVAAILLLVYLFARKIDAKRRVVCSLVTLSAFGLILAPWVLRNTFVLGTPIVTRSNLGLELAVGFDPATVESGSSRAKFWARMRQVHPRMSEAALARLRHLGGEVPYSEALKDETTEWLVANPGSAIIIALRHIRDFLFPPLWFWESENGLATAARPRMMLHWALSIFGVAGLAFRLAQNQPLFRYAIIMAVALTLPYLLVQPVLRYRYLIVALSAFFAADLFDRIVRECWRRRQETKPPLPPQSQI